MEQPSRLVFADAKLKKAFEDLKNSTEEGKRLFRFLIQAFENLEKNALKSIKLIIVGSIISPMHGD